MRPNMFTPVKSVITWLRFGVARGGRLTLYSSLFHNSIAPNRVRSPMSPNSRGFFIFGVFSLLKETLLSIEKFIKGNLFLLYGNLCFL